MTAMQDLRDVQADISEVQAELSTLKAALINRPDYPKSGATPKKSYITARTAYDKQRLELVAELNDLMDWQREVKERIDSTPMSGTSLSRILVTLFGVEDLLVDDRPGDAFQKLSALIDNLEKQDEE